MIPDPRLSWILATLFFARAYVEFWLRADPRSAVVNLFGSCLHPRSAEPYQCQETWDRWRVRRLREGHAG